MVKMVHRVGCGPANMVVAKRMVNQHLLAIAAHPNLSVMELYRPLFLPTYVYMDTRVNTFTISCSIWTHILPLTLTIYPMGVHQ